MSYDSGEIPDIWKLANVVPMHKKGSKSEVSNYRPISLTSLVKKIYEKLYGMNSFLGVDIKLIIDSMFIWFIFRVVRLAWGTC